MRIANSVFTMKLDAGLRDAFMAEAEAARRPASQVVRELMRDYVQQRRQEREYEDFLRSKVEAARAQIARGQYRSNEEVEADFSARRAKLRRKVGKSGR
jgi:predicted transcriptional regulator